MLIVVAAGPVQAQNRPAEAPKPIPLEIGVHLLLDDYFIARSTNVERRVIPPQRFLDAPVVTGSLEHQNWQPFFTILHDPAAKKNPFRMWYNVDVVDDPADGAYFGATGLLHSTDGIRWPGPYERLTSLASDGRVRFGANVLDDGPRHQPAAERYKLLYFDAGKQVGPRVAFSSDGLQWKQHEGGQPILKANNGDDIWSAAYDPIRMRYFLFGKTLGPYQWTNAEGKKIDATIRRYFTSFSQDFKTWSEPQLVLSPDDKDSGITQWYGPAGFMIRGDLIIAFLRELRDDLSPVGTPPEAIAANTKGSAGLGASGFGAAGGSGMGYTVLAWTRDGETWHRDRATAKYFEPDPRAGAWDHAMAWIGSAVPVEDDVYLYYAGYRWGHKFHHSVDRQIGMVKAKRDRFVAHEAGSGDGTILTPAITLGAENLSLNVDARGGEVRVQVTTLDGETIPGFTFQDCQPITSDSLAAAVQWSKPLATLRGKPVRLEFSLKNARLFGLVAS